MIQCALLSIISQCEGGLAFEFSGADNAVGGFLDKQGLRFAAAL
jgi:hypothetical protein